MAPEAANQKRKRGRPASASREHQSASQTQLTSPRSDTIDQALDDNNEVESDDLEAPRKRVRSARSNAPPQTESELRRSGGKRQNPTFPRRVSPRSSKNMTEPEPTAEDDQDEDSSFIRRSSRDRRSVGAWYKSSHNPEPHEEEEAPRSSLRPKAKRRNRPSPQSKPSAASKMDRKPPSLKRRGRPSLTGEVRAAEAAGKAISRQKKNAAPPIVGKDTGPLGQKRRQRGRRAAVTEQEQETVVEGQDQPRRKRRPRASDVSPINPKSRRRSSQTQLQPRSSLSVQATEPAAYRHLTNRIRRIPFDTITNKWSPLDASSISSVTDLLHSASRPVLLRLNNQQKHAQATAALNTVGNRLRSKLTRGLPFPPAIVANRREDELEFERTVDGIQTLEAQLDPLLHGVALLQKEKERAEKNLERDYKILNSLSTNARSGGRERRDQLRKLHALVPESYKDVGKDSKVDGEPIRAERAVGTTFVNLENEELKEIAGQLSNHMESMRGNLQQIDGIAPAMAEGRAALRAALLPHLNQALYEQVLLG